MIRLKSEDVKVLGLKTRRRRISSIDARIIGQKLLYLADEAEDHQSNEILQIQDKDDFLTIELAISPFNKKKEEELEGF